MDDVEKWLKHLKIYFFGRQPFCDFVLKPEGPPNGIYDLMFCQGKPWQERVHGCKARAVSVGEAM